MKRLFLLFGCLTAVFAHATTTEEWTDPETGITWECYVSGSDGGTIVGVVEGAKGHVVIPEFVPGPLGMHWVRTISPNIFANNLEITSVVIPSGIENIGEYFRGCKNLRTVQLKDGVKKIDVYAFENLTSLEDIDFPDTIEVIEKSAFAGCTQLREAYLPESLTRIEEGAFSGCTSLQKLYLPKALTTIGASAFYGCPLEEVVIPANVTSIGTGAFTQYEALTIVPSRDKLSLGEYSFGNDVSPKRFVATWVPEGVRLSNVSEIGVPEGVTTLPSNLFRSLNNASHFDTPITTLVLPETLSYVENGAYDFGVYNITADKITVLETVAYKRYELPPNITTLNIPKGTTEIKDNALEYLPRSITSVNIPEGVTSIGQYSFAYSYFASINVPETVTLIYPSAFDGCENLTSIHLPASVKGEGKGWFQGCYALQSITVSPENQCYTAEDGILYDKGKTCIIGIAPDFNFGDVVLPETITSLTPFRNCRKLSSITLSNGITELPYHCFEDCMRLEYCNLQEGVTTVEGSAFKGCLSLKSLHIPASVSHMPLDAFPPMSEMECLTVAEDNPLYFSKDNILYNKERTKILLVACKGVKGEVVLPEGITHLDEHTFSGCQALRSIVLPASLMSMGDFVFSGCTNLQAVHFSGGVPRGFNRATLYGKEITYPKEFSEEWITALAVPPYKGKIVSDATVEVLSEMMGPKQMRVTYIVRSNYPRVRVRVVAFSDGKRSFANLIPVRTGKNIPNGTTVATNTEQTFIWDIGSDWENDLGKVKVEVLVQEGALLPLRCIAIPAGGGHKAITITSSGVSEAEAFDALLWCYVEEFATGGSTLVLTEGVVKIGDAVVAAGDRVATNELSIGWVKPGETDKTYVYGASATTLLNYLYGKMGYKVLAGDDLVHAEAATRLKFKEGLGRVAVKITEAKE